MQNLKRTSFLRFPPRLNCNSLLSPQQEAGLGVRGTQLGKATWQRGRKKQNVCLSMASPVPRLRAGLCDRCMVTQELARKKQLELESAHLQSLQHLCVLSEPHPQSRDPSPQRTTGKERDTAHSGSMCLSQTHGRRPPVACVSSQFLGQGIPALLTFLGGALGTSWGTGFISSASLRLRLTQHYLIASIIIIPSCYVPG